jgi:hypothetical protein
MLVRRSTFDREVQRLETELRITRQEFDAQRASLLTDLRDTIYQDIERGVRAETGEERKALTRHHERFLRLIRVAQTLIPESRSNPDLPVYSEGHTEAEVRGILRELGEETSPFLLGKLRVEVKDGWVQ